MATDTTKEPTDNSELLKQLLEEQRRTNALLKQAERRAKALEAERRAKALEDEAVRAKIAKQEGVDPSQVLFGGGPTYSVIVRYAPAGDPRQVQPVANQETRPI